MQHNVTDTVLDALHDAHLGSRWRSPLGFSVVVLQDESVDPSWPTPSARVRTPRHRDAGAADLRWHEESPPHPARLTVLNPGAGSIVVDAGGVVDGGMSMRVIQATTFIPGRARVTVPVETIGARWWDEGQLLWRGCMDPVVAALVLQAALGSGAVASSARTVLWTLSAAEITPGLDVLPAAGSSGWVLVDEDGVVAGRMPNGRAATARQERSEPPGAGVVGNHESMDLRSAVRAAVDRGALAAHVAGNHRRARDLVILPRDFRLVDPVVAATYGQRAGVESAADHSDGAGRVATATPPRVHLQ